jgi:hypothetical protein
MILLSLLNVVTGGGESRGVQEMANTQPCFRNEARPGKCLSCNRITGYRRRLLAVLIDFG